MSHRYDMKLRDTPFGVFAAAYGAYLLLEPMGHQFLVAHISPSHVVTFARSPGVSTRDVIHDLRLPFLYLLLATPGAEGPVLPWSCGEESSLWSLIYLELLKLGLQTHVNMEMFWPNHPNLNNSLEVQRFNYKNVLLYVVVIGN